MDTRELIEKLLGIIEEYQQAEQSPPVDPNHFLQIQDLTQDDRSECEPANAPNEQYADVESVTTHAGGGVNGPKHPADIWTDSNRMYPEFRGFKHYLDRMDHDKY